MYYASYKPHDSKKRVGLEIFNEVMIMFLNYHLILFTRYNLSDYLKFMMGYSYVFIIGFTMFVNILLMIIK